MEAKKMIQNFSYHTHTNFSDGKNSLEEMLARAVELGWKEIGISDHMIIHRNLKNSKSWERWKTDAHIYHDDFSSTYEDFVRHAENVRKVSEHFNINVKVGAEVDFFTYSGWIDSFLKLKEKLGLDYYISGNHYLFIDDECENIIDIKDTELLPYEEQVSALKRHFKTIGKAAESGIFSFIAHLDYARKAKICGKDDFVNEKLELIKTLAATDTATELSTKGLRKGDDFYPNSNMLKEIAKNNIKVVISDDAHRICELGYKFTEAEEALKNAKILNRWTYVQK